MLSRATLRSGIILLQLAAVSPALAQRATNLAEQESIKAGTDSIVANMIAGITMLRGQVQSDLKALEACQPIADAETMPKAKGKKLGPVDEVTPADAPPAPPSHPPPPSRAAPTDAPPAGGGSPPALPKPAPSSGVK
jgi:hypothetical protein